MFGIDALGIALQHAPGSTAGLVPPVLRGPRRLSAARDILYTIVISCNMFTIVLRDLTTKMVYGSTCVSTGSRDKGHDLIYDLI